MVHLPVRQCASLLAAGAFIAMALAIPLAASRAQHGNMVFERWAMGHAIPLASVEPVKSTTDLRQLKSIIGSARVVAIGEPAHGAHEPLAFRNRLFRYLVEELGFTAIAMESGLAESRHVHAFIETGVGDARQIAREYISYGFGDWQENVELIQWMRDYNADPAHRQRVRFYGFDLSLGGDVGATPRPAPFEAALSLLSRADSASANRLRQALQPVLRLPPNPLPSLTPTERDATLLAVDELVSRLERSRPSLLAATSATEYEWGYRSAVVAQQVARFLRLIPADISAGIPPSAWEGGEARDAGMAANVGWIMAREGPRGRLLVFAHNGHVMSAPSRGTGILSVFAQAPNQLGVYLRSSLGADLVIIGTSSAANGSGLTAATIDSSSLDASLARVRSRRFLLDLRASRNNREAREWLSQPRLLRANFGAFYYNVPPLSAFDALVFIDTLTPAIVVR